MSPSDDVHIVLPLAVLGRCVTASVAPKLGRDANDLPGSPVHGNPIMPPTPIQHTYSGAVSSYGDEFTNPAVYTVYDEHLPYVSAESLFLNDGEWVL